MPISLTVLVPAGFCLSESHTHRHREEYNRKMELQLASINPYLALLDEKNRKAKIEELADKFFGNFEPVRTENESAIISKLVDEISKLAQEAFKLLKR